MKKAQKKEFIFKISIKEAREDSFIYIDTPASEIIRRIAILETQSLYTFARIIVKSFDFYFDHCFGFYSNVNSYHNSFDSYELFVDIGEGGLNPNTKGVKKTKIKDVFYEYKKMLFLFDHGDMWQFIVEKEDIKPALSRRKYPCIIEKIGPSPLQYPPLREDLEFEEEE